MKMEKKAFSKDPLAPTRSSALDPTAALLSIVYGNGDGDGDSCMRGWMGMGTTLKLVAGIGVGMGIRVLGTVRDGYRYMSP